MATVKTAKSPNPVARLDRIIGDCERVRQEADVIIDAYVDELRERHPGVPDSSLRFQMIANRAGSTLNIAAAMRLIRSTLVRDSV